jgi:hypothetical protein
MPATTNTTADRSGYALIVLRDGKVYEGDVEVRGPWVHLEGRRRIREHSAISYRAPGAKTWPYARLVEIRWSESPQRGEA